jgi:HEAT repeat protein
MAPKVLIACTKNEEEFAEKLVVPLRDAGYDVSHQGTVLVGESVVEEASRLLEEGAAVVLCGTQRAVGNTWVRRMVNAARRVNGGMLFIVQMEEEADVEAFACGEKIAYYWRDPVKALQDLIASLHKHYPTESNPAAAPHGNAAERHYRDLLLETCDIINLANLPEQDRHIAQKQRELKLRGLYIPLRVQVESAAGEESAATGQDEKLWESLEQRRSAAMRGKARDNAVGRQRTSVGEQMAKAKRLVILGDPGAGKTTLTRWIATAYLLRLKQDDDWKELPDVKTLPDADLLPIVIRCRDLDLSCLTGSLDDVLKHTLRRAELSEPEGVSLRELLRGRLENGTALLMLDGLDEITDPTARARFCQQLEQIVVAYPGAPIIATSRIVGYREMGYKLGRGFEHLTLADLAPEEKDDFARRWCLLTELPERRDMAVQELIHDIHSSDRIERLTGNPMLLTTMALVKRKVGKLPSRRADLYWEALQVLMNWRREVDEPMDWREALPQLEYVAYDMSDRGVQQVRHGEILDLFSRMRAEFPNVHAAQNRPPKEFLERLEARTGILVEAGHARHLGRLEPVYEFRHLTFQEYLAARALVDGCFPGYNAEQNLAAQVAPLAGRTAEMSYSEHGQSETGVVENWREALRLCAAICSDKDIDSVLLAILTPRENEGPAVARARAILSVLCLADEPNVSAPVAEQVLRAFVEEVREGDGGRPTRTGIDVAAEELVPTRWIGLLRAFLVVRFKQELTDSFAGLIATICSADALRNEPGLTTWLTEQTRRVRQHDESEAIEAALGVMAVAFAGKAQVVPGLVQTLLENISTTLPRAVASAWALAWLQRKERLQGGSSWRPTPADVDGLLRIVNDANSSPQLVRFMAWILGDQNVKEAAGPLLPWIVNSDSRVRRTVVQALGKIKSKAAETPLIARLDDSNPDVRGAAAQALGDIKSKAAETPLIARLDDSDPDVRGATAWALGEIKSKAAVAPLIFRLEDSGPEVRRAAAQALGQIKSEVAVASLIARLDDSDPDMRRVAAQALAENGSEAAVAPLIARLDDGDADVRKAALDAVSKRLDGVDRKLLTRDLDGLNPFLDPHDPILNQAAAAAASKLSLTMEETRERYEVLAEQFHLSLEWRPVLPLHS